jgi:NAD(P)-dependent dehydrogenase (short-subunit alcohol dehydrogenase family)
MEQNEQDTSILISSGNLAENALEGQVAIVTGAGRGIGFEAARSLVWLGAQVIIAEIDKNTGGAAAEKINTETGEVRAAFIQVDAGDEKSVKRLRDKAFRAYGKVDIIINNATISPIGAVKDLPVDSLDGSYRVNLRGPALLAAYFLPGMLERDYGVFICVTSTGGAFTGGYGVFKRAQVELADTLAAEIENTGVIVFTIDPGQVLTPGLEESAAQLAPLYGKTYDEFISMNEGSTISVEAAGAGLAAAVALASKFRGQEISSIQALAAAEIRLRAKRGETVFDLTDEQMAEALELCRGSRNTLADQAEKWRTLPLFEQKWMLSNFRKVTGLTDEEWLEALGELEQALENRDSYRLAAVEAPIEKLADYWKHLHELAGGYINDPDVLKKQRKIITGWQKTAEKLAGILKAGTRKEQKD